MLAGSAPRPPLPLWLAPTRSRIVGQVTRYRLNRGGDRQLNRALHTIVLVRLRDDPDTRACLARRTAEGKSRRDVKRCLRRIIARQLFRLLERNDQPGVEILRAA
jgi:transposase